MALLNLSALLLLALLAITARAAITHQGTEVKWDKDGAGVTVKVPPKTRAGDLMILAIHRTDYYLPLKVSGWTRVAECYKSDNGKCP